MRADDRPDVRAPGNPQFGLGQLLLLTAVVAVVCAVAMRFQAPLVSRIVLIGYCTVWVGWFVLRGPAVLNRVRHQRAQLRQLQARRIELEQQVGRTRRNIESARAARNNGDER